jgi:cytosine deaminase
VAPLYSLKLRKWLLGNNVNFEGNIPFLKAQGVEVELLNDKESIELMANFIKEKPELWHEDIAEP